MIHIYAHRNIDIFLANSQSFKADGITFCIKSQSKKSTLWKYDTKKLSTSLSYAIQLANFIVTDPRFFEMWANIIIKKNGIFIYGRRINSRYWGKPITTIKKSIIPTNPEIQLLKKIISEYKFKEFSILSEKALSLSSDEHKDAEHIFWLERPERKKKFVLLTTKKFIITAPLKPHLNGLHIQIFPRNAYWDSILPFVAPWQVKKFNLKSNAVLQGNIELKVFAIKIIQKLAEHRFNIEYHMSGNWDSSLMNAKKLLNKRKVFSEKIFLPKKKDTAELNKIKSKIHLGGTGHGQIYQTQSYRQKVILPSRPEEEKPKEWAEIKKISITKVKLLQKLLYSKLK